MTGITPAVLTFSGISEDCPLLIILLPCIFAVYCTGMWRSASQSSTTKTVMNRMKATIIRPATTAVAGDFAFMMKRSQSVAKSFGIEDRMLIKSTIEMPLPTPFSVILSPIHMRKAEPAVIAAIVTKILFRVKWVKRPWLPKPTAMAID